MNDEKRGANRKELEDIDHAVMDVIDRLRDGTSGRKFEELSGVKHTRMATILARDTPPATLSEIEMMAAVFGLAASDIIAEAEDTLGGGNVVPLRPVSDPPGNVTPLAAGRSVQAEMETHEQN